MKHRILLLSILSSFPILLNAQNTFPTNGNVGIGTDTPSEKVHIIGKGLFESSDGNNYLLKIDPQLGIETEGTAHWLHLNRYTSNDVAIGYSSTANVFLANGGGKVGIGTSNLRELFQIGNSYTFHNGGHKVLGFMYSAQGGMDLDPSLYSAEIRFEPATGNFRLGTSSTTTNGPATHLAITKQGNIGLGTLTPSGKLNVKGNTYIDGGELRIRHANDAASSYRGLRLQSSVYDSNSKITAYHNSGAGLEISAFNTGSGNIQSQIFLDPGNKEITFETNQSNRMVIKENGAVGIGTTTPSAKLEIVDNTTNTGNYSDGVVQIAGDNNVIGFVGQSNLNPGLNRWGIKLRETQDGDFSIHSYTKNNSPFLINSSGNIGIGTTSPDSKLSVNGTIHTKEVKVDLTGWSDFVFYDDYKLPSLKEVEAHIKEKGHLEDIPSEEDVIKDGILLGEMNSKLLQKIEELTLYTIEQDKALDTQSKEIEALKNENKKLEALNNKFNDLQKRLEQLENK